MDINNTNNTNNTCPGCGRHCDLSSPHCPTGREYAETGKLPEGGGHHHSHEHHDVSSMSGDEKLMHLLRLLSRTLNHSAEPTGGQDRVLRILAEKGAMGQKELMDMLGIKAGSLSELLSKLANSGLISREKSENDHRAVNVSITDAGRKKAESVGEGTSPDLLGALSEEEKQQLTALLEKLTADWRQKFGGPGKGGQRPEPFHEQGHERRDGYGREHGREPRDGRSREQGHGHDHHMFPPHHGDR